MASSNTLRMLSQCRNLLHGCMEVGLMVRLLGIPTGQRVLQVGCGSGIALASLSRLRLPRMMTGIDIDAFPLIEAEGRLRAKDVDAHLVQADVRDMPFPDGFFDLVIDFGLCNHVKHPGDELREIARVLNVSGTFVCETPMAHPLADRNRRLPWSDAPSLTPVRRQLLWASRTKRHPGRPLASHTSDDWDDRI